MPDSPLPELQIDTYPLDRLAEVQHPGLSTRLALSLAEAAAVCLDRSRHVSPTLAKLNDCSSECAPIAERSCYFSWEEPTARTRTAWSTSSPSVEWGAVCIALLIAQEQLSLRVKTPARIGTTFDYFLEPAQDAEGRLYQKTVRLEVAGRTNSAQSVLDLATREKWTRMQSKELTGHRIVVVVGFQEAIVQISQSEEEAIS
jgi:hypothetical protein